MGEIIRLSRAKMRDYKELPAHFTDPGVLLPEARNFYDRFTRGLIEDYELENNRVKRMSALRKNGLIPDDKADTNLLHIVSFMRIARDWHYNYPQINSVNFARVQIHGGIHDNAELVPKIGDVSPVERTKLDELRKQQEPHVGRTRVISRIPDQQLQDEVLQFYDAYEKNDPNDTEVQMARLIDKYEGTRQVAKVGTTVNAGKENALVRLEQHLWVTMGRILKPAMNLLVALPTHEERSTLRQIWNDMFDEFEDYNSEVANTYRGYLM